MSTGQPIDSYKLEFYQALAKEFLDHWRQDLNRPPTPDELLAMATALESAASNLRLEAVGWVRQNQLQ